MEKDARPHVVIIGGGFGGLAAARALRKAPVRVTLVDRKNHHLFQPLLYQVATASLNPSDISAPLRRVLRKQQNLRVLLGEVRAIDTVGRCVKLHGAADDDVLRYDYLIVASGASHAYFGHDEYEPWAPGLKSIEDAVEIRRRVLTAYEEAERARDPEERRRWLTFVIVGAGPTGVELAGAFGEISRQTLPGEYSSFDPAQARILLVEGGPRILPTFAAALSARAQRTLERLGVEVRLGTPVTHVDATGVRIGPDGHEERVEARTVVWAAGVQASPIVGALPAEHDRAGRVLVAPDLTLPAAPEIAVIGDAAHVLSDGKMVPGLAPAAMQMGRHAARNIVRRLGGASTLPFRYRDKGTMATIGRGSGIAERGRVKVAGFVGWLAWLFIHLLFLIGFRNRVVVLFDWAWAFFTRQRNARLITDTAEHVQFALRAQPQSQPPSLPRPDGGARPELH